MPKKKTPASASTSSTRVGKSQRKPIRNNVRKLRRERKWTQWQLAQISRLSQRTVQRIERGARMGITAELALASAFDVEISELYASAPSGKRSGMDPDVPQRLQTLRWLVTISGDCEAGSKIIMDQTIKPRPTPASKPQSPRYTQSCWPPRPGRACEPVYSPACGSSRVRSDRPPRVRPDGAAS